MENEACHRCWPTYNTECNYCRALNGRSQNYKINIHAHSIFSDGTNTPLKMAMKAQDLGFCSLVITDHFYGRQVPEFMSTNSMHLLRKACAEARKILPVIIGMEVPFCGQEVLIFGGEAIKSILEYGKPTRPFGSLNGKQRWCNSDAHRGEDFEEAAKYVDTKITDEHALIKYIKRGKQPAFFLE